jgi:hypothetical protein
MFSLPVHMAPPSPRTTDPPSGEESPPDDEVVVPLDVPLDDVPLDVVDAPLDVVLELTPPLLPEVVVPDELPDSASVSVPPSPLDPVPLGPVPEFAHPTAAVPPSSTLAADKRKSRETLTTFYLRPNILVGCGLAPFITTKQPQCRGASHPSRCGLALLRPFCSLNGALLHGSIRAHRARISRTIGQAARAPGGAKRPYERSRRHGCE